jgi:hypothetical protein
MPSLKGTDNWAGERNNVTPRRQREVRPQKRYFSFRAIVRPAKAGMFRGRQSHQGKSRNPVAWVACNESEGRALSGRAKAAGRGADGLKRRVPSAGWRGSTVTRTCQATGEIVLLLPGNRGSKVDRITGETGKAVEGETVAARPVVAEKPASKSTEGENPERWRQGTPLFDSIDSGPGGPGSVEAHYGTDLRGRLSTGLVWLLAEEIGARCHPSAYRRSFWRARPM